MPLVFLVYSSFCFLEEKLTGQPGAFAGPRKPYPPPPLPHVLPIGMFCVQIVRKYNYKNINIQM